MVKMIVVLLFGIAMFCASAGGSWYLQNQVLGTPKAKAEDKEKSEHEDPALASIAASNSPKGASIVATSDHPPAGASGSDPLPVPVRPGNMSVEELLRYSMGVKSREEKVKQSEELLHKRKVQQQLALTDMEGERREIDGLRTQVTDQLKQAEVLVERLNDVRNQFLRDKDAASQSLQQMKHERVSIDEEHMDNTKRLSAWIQSMDPEKAADVLSSMANDGTEQMEIAVQILRNLEEREAAKILSAIDDTKLVQQLIEKFRHLQKPPAKTAARR